MILICRPSINNPLKLKHVIWIKGSDWIIPIQLTCLSVSFQVHALIYVQICCHFFILGNNITVVLGNWERNRHTVMSWMCWWIVETTAQCVSVTLKLLKLQYYCLWRVICLVFLWADFTKYALIQCRTVFYGRRQTTWENATLMTLILNCSLFFESRDKMTETFFLFVSKIVPTFIVIVCLKLLIKNWKTDIFCECSILLHIVTLYWDCNKLFSNWRLFSSHSLLCTTSSEKPKDNQLAITYNKENQQILTFEKL